jgi:hypothetical protein
MSSSNRKVTSLVYFDPSLILHQLALTRERCLSQRLAVTLVELAGTDQPLDLLSPDTLDLVGDLQSVQLASKGGNLVGVDLALDSVDITQDGIDLSSAGIAGASKVVGVLDTTLENTLVLLDGVLGSLLSLLVSLLVGLGLLLSLLGGLLLGLLLETSLLLGLLLSLLLGHTVLVLGLLGLLPEPLDTLIASQTVIDQLAQTGVVLSLLLLASVHVLALHVTLLVTVLVVIGNILVKVLEGSPAVKVVPEVVESLDILLVGVLVAEQGNRLGLAEAGLGLEDTAPRLVELVLGLLLGRGLDVGLLINRVELAALGGVEENLGGLLDALEEVVILRSARGGLLVGVVLEDLLAVGTLDLVLSGLVSELGETEDLVVILRLKTHGISKQFGFHRWGPRHIYLPVLGITLEHQRVLRLAVVFLVVLLDLLGGLLGLDAVILGEGALVAGTAGVGQEVRANGLDGALGRRGDGGDGLEVLLSRPSLGQSQDWARHGSCGGHLDCGL